MQTPEETLALASGSCREFELASGPDPAPSRLRRPLRLGLPRSSSSPTSISLDGPPGTDHDFTDLHAWAEVYLPGAGWIGLDPTSGLLAGESHIPLAATPHYRNAAPISGTGELRQRRVRLRHAGRARLRASAHHQALLRGGVERARPRSATRSTRILKAEDVRLTMGGEPTFVSIDDYESAEWNTDAVGPTKRALADRLVRRLRDRFAPGGFLHYGQGKWYPGESLPRWTFSLYWRRDGKPIWKRRRPDRARAARTPTPVQRRRARCSTAVADELGVDEDYIAPAYEDPAEWIVKEGNLPENVTPENSKLKDPEERQRIARVFARGPHRAFRLRAADPALAGAGERRRTGAARNGRRAAARSFSCRATARSATACRSARCPTYRRRRFPYVMQADPTDPRAPLPDVETPQRHARSAVASFAARRKGAGRRRSGSSSDSATSAARCAPRSRSKRATGGSACSCRRSSSSRTISN